jgi:hypothetical protein
VVQQSAPGNRVISPDGNYWWDGSQWVPVASRPTPALPVPQTIGPASAIAAGGRSYSPDGKHWWDGERWLPYKRITWNSLHLGTNPPEDRAGLARNLGMWCAVFGTVALIGVVAGAFSILAAIAGPVAILNGIAFHRNNARSGGRLPGSNKATLGIVLGSVGILEFITALVLRVALAAVSGH